MRIISGTLRGKKLFTPADNRIRPTADRAREAVFNILNSRLDFPLAECDVLDVFAGTGAFGLEAYSRGAKTVVFVDTDLTLAKKNAAACKINNAKFIQSDARLLPPTRRSCNLIFLDAPYNQGLTAPALQALLKGGWCAPNAWIIAETARDEALPLPPELELADERTYGAARFSFLRLALSLPQTEN